MRREKKRGGEKRTYQFLGVNHTKLNVLNWFKLSHYAIRCEVCGCKMAWAKLKNSLRVLGETRSGGRMEERRKSFCTTDEAKTCDVLNFVIKCGVGMKIEQLCCF